MPENKTEVLSSPLLSKASEFSHVKEELSSKDKEITGVWEAIQYVDRLAKKKPRSINETIVREIHKKVMGYFHPEVAGNYRGHEVAISKAIFLPVHWSKVREEMFKFGGDLEEKTSKPESRSSAISNLDNVLELGAWAHYQFVKIHPFADGNGRAARLLTDLIFKRAGLYYITDWGEDKDQYINSLKRVDETGDLVHFRKFLAERLTLRYSELIRKLLKQNETLVAKSAVFQGLINTRNELEKIANLK